MGPRHFSRGILQKHAVHRVAVRASMGPRHFSRGISARCSCKLCNRHCELQWGHGISAVEFAQRGRDVAAGRGFNGATAFQPWN